MIQVLTAYQTASGNIPDGDEAAPSKPFWALSTVQARQAPITVKPRDWVRLLSPTIKLRAPQTPSNSARDTHNLYSF
jgi:hypothetical protein